MLLLHAAQPGCRPRRPRWASAAAALRPGCCWPVGRGGGRAHEPPPEVRDLGPRPYAEALELQRELCRRRWQGELAAGHPAAGRASSRWSRWAVAPAPSSLPLAAAELERRGVEVFEVERGGDVTYHGPGSSSGIRSLDLREHRRDLHWYLRQLEAALIAALARLGVPASGPGPHRRLDRGRKIASIGIHVKQWVTLHGFALNVTTDLALVRPDRAVRDRAGGDDERGGGARAAGRPTAGARARRPAARAVIEAFARGSCRLPELVDASRRRRRGTLTAPGLDVDRIDCDGAPAAARPDRHPEMAGAALRHRARGRPCRLAVRGHAVRGATAVARPGTSCWRCPGARRACDIHCVTRWSRYDNVFEGVPVQALLQRAGVQPEARLRAGPRRAGLHHQPAARGPRPAGQPAGARATTASR